MNKNNPNKEKIKEIVDIIVEQSLLEFVPIHKKSIISAVMDPINDVGSSIKAAASTIFNRTGFMLKALGYITATILLPSLKFDYDLFKKDNDAVLAKINEKYKDVFARNWQALKHPDAFGFLMLAYPQAMLAEWALSKSPMAAFNVLETILPGNESVRKTGERLRASGMFLPRTPAEGGGGMGGGGGGGGYMDSMGYGDYGGDYGGDGGAYESRKVTKGSRIFLSEAPVAQPLDISHEIQVLMADPSVQAQLNNSPVVNDLHAAAIEEMTGPIKRITSVTTLDGLKEFFDPSAIEQAKAKLEENIKKELALPKDPKSPIKDETTVRKVATDKLLSDIKQAYKPEFIKRLQISATTVPGSMPVVNQAISQIQSLK